MNLLYSTVQRQGGTGSIETAMSPYLVMTGNGNGRNMRNASVDSVSAIYAQIGPDGETSSGNGGGGRTARTAATDGVAVAERQGHPGAVAMVSPWSVEIGTELAPAARSVPDISRVGR